MKETANLIAVLVLLMSVNSSAIEITLEDNGYKNVVVSISPDIPQTDGQRIIDGIKSWITLGSRTLFTATRKLAYISTVQILIPQGWADVDADAVTTDVAYEDGVIRVDSENPLFGNVPNTIQASDCGERGEVILVSPAYLLQLQGQSTQWFGPPGNVFVHEWAKLRYGVFEEHGYPSDPVYPMFYLRTKYTADGPVTELLPNFCTNEQLQGHREDFVNGGPCRIDGVTGLPDQNCLFVPDGNNANVRSSFMAAPFLTSTDRFCESGESLFPHDNLLPNRHNSVCGGRSTWSVLQANEDFVGVVPSTAEGPPDPVFAVVRPSEGHFVMVLDISGSMTQDQDYPTRLDKLKQSTIRWTRHDIRDGSYLGVTSFSLETYQDHRMTEIDSESRLDIIDDIGRLDSESFTCLGAGVRRGLRTLSQTSPSGGVMIFVTDGEFNCPREEADDDSNLDDPVLIQEILDSKVRIVTIAFGETADPNLENLATITNGRSYTVSDDSGIEDINDALQGCLTYQPTLPTRDMDFVIFTKQYEDYDNDDGDLSDEFVVDRTIGRDVRIQIDHNNRVNIKEVVVRGPGEEGEVQTFPFVQQEDGINVFVVNLDNMMEGTYGLSIVTRPAGPRLDYAIVVITSKAKDAETQPFSTKCWASAGSSDVDLTTTSLAIYAQVTQGNRAVMNADVEALIERVGSPTPIIRLDLLDNGSGADRTANDGLYSRYFARSDGGAARYILRCHVRGTDASDVNEGFAVSRKNKEDSRAYPQSPAAPPPCCGSDTVNENTIREPTGRFTREAAGGSFKIVRVPGQNDDVFSPVRVTDLSAQMDPALEDTSVLLSFTSPGDDFDAGIAATYDVRHSDNASLLFDNFDSATRLNSSWILPGYDLDPVEGGSRKEVAFRSDPDWGQELVYFAVKTRDEAGNTAEVSNLAGVFIGRFDEGVESTTTATTTTTTTRTTTMTTVTATSTTSKASEVSEVCRILLIPLAVLAFLY